MKKLSQKQWYILVTTFFVFLLGLHNIFSLWINRLPPLVLDSISTSETNNLGPFEKIKEEDWGVQKTPFPNELYPIPKTPYVFCRYTPYFTLNENPNIRYEVDIVIDIDKGKRVLRVDRKSVFPSQDYRQQFSKNVQNYGVVQSDQDLCLFYQRFERTVPTFKQNFGFIPDWYLNFLYTPKYEYWTLNLQGDLNEINKIPTCNFYGRERNRSFEFSRLAGAKFTSLGKGILHDYEIEHDRLRQSDHWSEEYDGFQLLGLPGGGYLLNNDEEKCITFLLPGESESFSISRDALLNKLPQTPTLPKAVNWIPFSTQPGLTYLAYLDAPYFPIFEFQLDQYKKQTDGDWVKFIGYGNEMRPVMTVENNQIILFGYGYDDMRRGISQWPNYQNKSFMICNGLAALPARALPVTSDGQPAERPISCILPQPINSISTIPLSDDRLLGYYDGVFWSFCWDGSDFRQLFPSDKEMPLVSRPKQKSVSDI
ncbi:MAG: hypothetical protein AB1656_15820 [Candidatus Omnitrophota bacterium]